MTVMVICAISVLKLKCIQMITVCGNLSEATINMFCTFVKCIKQNKIYN